MRPDNPIELTSREARVAVALAQASTRLVHAIGFPKGFTGRERRRVQRWLAVNAVFAEMLLACERGGPATAQVMLADIVGGATESMNVWCRNAGQRVRFGAHVWRREAP